VIPSGVAFSSRFSSTVEKEDVDKTHDNFHEKEQNNVIIFTTSFRYTGNTVQQELNNNLKNFQAMTFY